MGDLVSSSSRSGASAVNPTFLDCSHFFTPSRVVGSSKVKVRFGVEGAEGMSDWDEGIAKYSSDDGETLLDFLPLPNPSDGPNAFEGPGPSLAGSAPELTFGQS